MFSYMHPQANFIIVKKSQLPLELICIVLSLDQKEEENPTNPATKVAYKKDKKRHVSSFCTRLADVYTGLQKSLGNIL